MRSRRLAGGCRGLPIIGPMPKRATKRGEERTPLDRDCDVLICGASFAGLAVARELAGSGADVLVIDRYEIGERQTSACGIPTGWLRRMDLPGPPADVRRARHPHAPHDRPLRPAVDVLHLRLPRRCAPCWPSRARRFEFETAKVDRAPPATPSTPTAARSRAPLIVDALGWRRVLGRRRRPIQPPDALLSRGLEVHPARHRRVTSRSGSTAVTSRPATAGASRPTASCGSASARSTRATTSRSRPCGSPADLARRAGRLSGQLDPPPDPRGDRGRRLLRRRLGRPLPAADRRGHPHRPVLRPRLRPRAARGGRGPAAEGAGARPATGRSRTQHAWKFRWLLRVQHLVGHATGTPVLGAALRIMDHQRFIDWAFAHYRAIAPPEFARAEARPAESPRILSLNT